VVGWEVDWCAPVACDSTQNYYEGMTKADFKTNAAKTCGSVGGGTFTQPEMVPERSGYSAPPLGFFVQGSAFRDLRWAAGDPVWCTDTNSILIPFRYFRHDPVAAWGLTANAWGFGGGTGTALSLTCLSSTGVSITATDTASSVQTSSSGNNALVTWPANAANKTIDGSKSFESKPFFINATGNRPLWALFNSSTNCVTILNLTMTVRTDTIGGLSTVEWSAARAVNGKTNSWGENIEALNCAGATQPIECIGQDVAPYRFACESLTVDPKTWGQLGPCMIGGPDDYIRGAAITDADLDSLPVPGTGSCAPWTLGTLYDAPFVIDICDWYPTWRPAFDILMTASLWVGFAAGAFRTKSGDN